MRQSLSKEATLGPVQTTTRIYTTSVGEDRTSTAHDFRPLFKTAATQEELSAPQNSRVIDPILDRKIGMVVIHDLSKLSMIEDRLAEVRAQGYEPYVFVPGTSIKTKTDYRNFEKLTTINATRILDASALIKTKVYAYKQEKSAVTSGRVTDQMIADDLGISASNLSVHKHSNQGFISRTWARIKYGLKISDTEQQNTILLSTSGISAQTRIELKNDIRSCIAQLEPIEIQGDKILTFDEMYNSVLQRFPELKEFDKRTLGTIIDEVRIEEQITDPNERLYKEIKSIHQRITKLHSREIEEQIRHQQLGNLFEELAMLSFHASGDFIVPQYGLSISRDSSGKVLHTTDIIDAIKFSSINDDNVLEKAIFDIRVSRGECVLVNQGTITRKIKRSGEKAFAYEYFHEASSGKTIFTNKHRTNLQSERLIGRKHGRWFQYQEVATGKKSFVTHFTLPFDNLDSNSLKFVGEPELQKLSSPLSREETFLSSKPFVAIELKKGGSKNVNAIVKQLRKQKQAIQFHQALNPESIPGLTRGILVISLTPNRYLEEAVTKLNKEGRFFQFQTFGDALLYNEVKADVHDRTLAEVLLLKRFLARANHELSQAPTLVPIDSLVQDPSIEGNSSVVRESKESIEKLTPGNVRDALSDLLAKLKSDRIREEAKERHAVVRDKAKAFYEDCRSLLSSPELVTEERLLPILQKHFGPAVQSLESVANAMFVWEERHGALEKTPRVFLSRDKEYKLPEQVEAVLRRYPQFEADLRDPESLSDLISDLNELLEQERRSYDSRKELDAILKRDFFKLRFNSPRLLSELEFADRSILLTPCAAGPFARLKQKLGYSSIDPLQAASEEIVLSAFASLIPRLVRENPDSWFADTFGHYNRYDQSYKDTDPLAKDAENAYQALEVAVGELLLCGQAAQADVQERLHRNSEELFKVKGQFKSVFSWSQNYVDLTIDDKLEFIGRQSTELSFHDILQTSFEDCQLSQDLQAKIMQQIDAESSLTAVLEEPDIQSLRSNIEGNLFAAKDNKLGDSLDDNEREQLHKLVNTLSTEIQRVFSDRGSSIAGAAITREKFLEENILFEGVSRINSNALIISSISPQLAQTYIAATTPCFIQFPDTFSDHFVDVFVKIQKQLENDELASALVSFLEDTADSKDMHTRLSSFLSAVIQISLYEQSLLSTRNDPLPPSAQKVLTLILSGDFNAASEKLSEKLPEIDELLWRMHRVESKDIHLRWVRRAGNGALMQSLRDENDLGAGTLLFGNKQSQFTKFFESMHREQLEKFLKATDDLEASALFKQLQIMANELLSGLSSRVQAFPQETWRPIDIVSNRHVSGTRRQHSLTMSQIHLLRENNPLLHLFLYEPRRFLQFANYKPAYPWSGYKPTKFSRKQKMISDPDNVTRIRLPRNPYKRGDRHRS